MCSLLPDEHFQFLCSDSVAKSVDVFDVVEELCDAEFLNNLKCSSLTPHCLILKIGTPVMLLCYIDQSLGLCNGTRLCTTHFDKNKMC